MSRAPPGARRGSESDQYAPPADSTPSQLQPTRRLTLRAPKAPTKQQSASSHSGGSGDDGSGGGGSGGYGAPVPPPRASGRRTMNSGGYGALEAELLQQTPSQHSQPPQQYSSSGVVRRGSSVKKESPLLQQSAVMETRSTSRRSSRLSHEGDSSGLNDLMGIKEDGEDGEGEYEEEDAQGEAEVDDEAAAEPDPPDSDTSQEVVAVRKTTTRFGRQVKQIVYKDPDEEDDEDEMNLGAKNGGRPTRNTRSSLGGFVVDDPEDESEDEDGRPKRKLRSRKPPPSNGNGRLSRAGSRGAKKSSKKAQQWDKDGEYEEADNGYHSATVTEEAEEEMLDLGDDDEDDDGPRGRTTRGAARGRDEDAPRRNLRQTERINYAIPPPPEELPKKGGSRFGVLGGTGGGGRRLGGAASSMNAGFMMDLSLGTGGDPTAGMGPIPDSDSDNDDAGQSKRRPPNTSGMAMAGSAPKPLDPAFAGNAKAGPSQPNASGRFDKQATSALADADPLGVDLNVSFDQVGGLDDHINQLKEMVALPLLYPELYQQFGLIPPRGVLFHGPPGTGKTLLARALAASCSTSTTKITFFMRKGADVLSKWVGEAERQLRLLFEEARNAQPSIIFFDEIDGLAPVRSSKQDQIHASLVSTLLALMDGMDGRGQVIVIGATNRPDAVDPALRRPGRFDREFYFPLPNKVARKKIIGINTRKWDPPLEDGFLEELATLTKGYGGADLRALCTEAALNAIQRRYPQVYKTSDRLLLDPSSVKIQAKDFMASIRKIVPSSARSASSAAAPLPAQLMPLLNSELTRVKEVVTEVLPSKKRPSVLEEAEWEDEHDDGSFAREMMLQSFETMQVYRPRVLVHGKSGMGQRYIASGLLHHLEGYNVQSLDLASLLGQSNRTIETAVTEMFVEAKRHQPSVLFIPALAEWCNVIPETTRATLGALLDSLTSTEPILLFALVDGKPSDLPRDVQSWFGFTGENEVELCKPSETQRSVFFADLLANIRRPPTQFPDGVPRKRRVLEKLAIAPPLAPKPPSEALIAMQKAKDTTLKEIITYRLGPILADLKKKHKKATYSAGDAFTLYNLEVAKAEHNHIIAVAEAAAAAEQLAEEEATLLNGHGEHDPAAAAGDDAQLNGDHQPMAVDSPNRGDEVVAAPATPAAVPPPAVIEKPYYVDFDLMQNKLMDPNSGYLTLRSFLRDIERMADNVKFGGPDTDRRAKAHAMVVEAKLLLKDHFQDEQQKADFEAMAIREHERRALTRPKKKPSLEGSPREGARQSPRLNGLAPQFGLRDLEANTLEAARRKRMREDGSVSGTPGRGSSDPEGSAGEPAYKRARFNNGVMVPSHLGESSLAPAFGEDPSGAEINGVFTPNGVASTSAQALITPPGSVHQPPPISSSEASALTSLVDNENAVAGPVAAVGQGLMEHVPPTITPVTVPEPVEEEPPVPFVPPPFECPEQEIQQLSVMLSNDTAVCNVEELEQLRAACLRKIWKHRATWNRAELVQELVETIETFVQHVKRSYARMEED